MFAKEKFQDGLEIWKRESIDIIVSMKLRSL